MRVARIVIVAAALAASTGLVLGTPAAAHTKKTEPTPTVLTTAVGAPFNLAVRKGSVLVADGGAESIGRVEADGSVTTIVSGVPGASGVAASGRYLAYTTTVGGAPPVGISASGLTITGPKGFTKSADLLAYERARNPDAKIRYGVDNPSQCVIDELTKAGFPVSYTGLIDSHAYSVTAAGGRWVVADAGANALVTVTTSGKVSTLAVLPRHPMKITAAIAAQLGLADCVVGTVYNFESVPTDVEVGRDGFLYVTTLPGGPEDPSFGARGKVFRVNPWTGRHTEIASGLAGAVNLAIADGTIYVAELFGGRISKITHGRVSEYLALPGALAVEAGPRGTLYAATGITGPPSVVKISTSKGWKR